MSPVAGTGAVRRWKAVALLVTGVLIGALLVPPVGAHVSGWAHNWKQHIRPKADRRFFTKSQANSRFVRGYEVVTKTSTSNSTSPKSQAAFCPEGKVPIGGGSGIGGSVVNVVLTFDFSGFNNQWLSEARETGDGQGGNWTLTTRVICAFAEPES